MCKFLFQDGLAILTGLFRISVILNLNADIFGGPAIKLQDSVYMTYMYVRHFSFQIFRYKSYTKIRKEFSPTAEYM